MISVHDFLKLLPFLALAAHPIHKILHPLSNIIENDLNMIHTIWYCCIIFVGSVTAMVARKSIKLFGSIPAESIWIGAIHLNNTIHELWAWNYRFIGRPSDSLPIVWPYHFAAVFSRSMPVNRELYIKWDHCSGYICRIRSKCVHPARNLICTKYLRLKFKLPDITPIVLDWNLNTLRVD